MTVNFVVHFSANDYNRIQVRQFCNRLNNYYDGYEFTIGGTECTQRLYYYNVDKSLLPDGFLTRLQHRGIEYKILNNDVFNYNFD